MGQENTSWDDRVLLALAVGMFIGYVCGCITGVYARNKLAKEEAALVQSELVERGHKAYHPKTGELMWTEEID
jgi:hypothetical protein